MSTSSSMTRSGYSVGSTTRTCAATGRALATGEAAVAALVQLPETEEFRRVDFALEAWLGGSRPRAENGARLPVLGSWRCVVPEPGAKKRILIDDESLLDLFEQSEDPAAEGGAAVEERRAFRFMLALILLRKRLLVCEKTGRDGTMFVRPRGAPKASEGGALSPVEDPGLTEESIARVVSQLSAVLEGDTSAASGPGAPGQTGEGAAS